jgi:hypothetical protein
LLDGERHQRQVRAIFLPGEGQLLDEGGIHRAAAEKAAITLAHEIDDAEKICLRIDFEKVVKNLFSPTPIGEPVMDDRRLHSFLNNINVMKICNPTWK